MSEGGMDTAKIKEVIHNLHGSQVTVPFSSPIKVILGGQELEAGKPEDLGIGKDEDWKADCVVIDRDYLRETNEVLGFKRLRNGESIDLGRESAHRFRFEETVSRVHARIGRIGDNLTIKDLNSTNGTVVVVSVAPRS